MALKECKLLHTERRYSEQERIIFVMEGNMAHFGDVKEKKRQYSSVGEEEKKIYIIVDTIIKEVEDMT